MIEITMRDLRILVWDMSEKVNRLRDEVNYCKWYDKDRLETALLEREHLLIYLNEILDKELD